MAVSLCSGGGVVFVGLMCLIIMVNSPNTFVLGQAPLGTNTIEDLENVEHDPNYPYDDIRNYVKNNPVLRQYFERKPPTIPTTTLRPHLPDNLSFNISDLDIVFYATAGNVALHPPPAFKFRPAMREVTGCRVGTRAGVPAALPDETICKIRQFRVLHPKRLKNIHNEWKIVVNVENEYVQGVEVKQCVRENRACPYMDSLPFAISSYCAQDYLVKDLMVYNSTQTFDLFRFPSCCVCKIKKNT